MAIAEMILIFIVVILLLVVSHELGHFFAAKSLGIRVDEFGIGIPPRVIGIKKGETLYSINLLPLGGFVRIFGEEGENSSDPRSFSGRGFWPRSFVVAAGVIGNLIVAVILLSLLAGFGLPQLGVKVESVTESSPAKIAGIQPGDIIIGLRHAERSSVAIQDVQDYVQESEGGELLLFLERAGREIVISASPRVNPPAGEGALGIVMSGAPVETGFVKVNWFMAPIEGLKMTYLYLELIIKGISEFFIKFFTTGEGPETGEVGGPILIAYFAREAFEIGMRQFLQLLALLSLNLAIINFLPIPALDGGRILFFIIEKIKGSPIPAKVANGIHSSFFLILIFLLSGSLIKIYFFWQATDPRIKLKRASFDF